MASLFWLFLSYMKSFESIFLLFLVIWKYCGKLQLKKSRYNAISAREGGVPMFWFIWLSCVSKSIKGCSRNWILGKHEFHENSTMYSSYFWTTFLQQPKFDKSRKYCGETPNLQFLVIKISSFLLFLSHQWTNFHK